MGNLSMLRSYAQGDDFILGQSTSAPGQALSVNVIDANTACAGGVATTTIPVDVVAAETRQGSPAGQAACCQRQDAGLDMCSPCPDADLRVGSIGRWRPGACARNRRHRRSA